VRIRVGRSMRELRRRAHEFQDLTMVPPRYSQDDYTKGSLYRRMILVTTRVLTKTIVLHAYMTLVVKISLSMLIAE